MNLRAVGLAIGVVPAVFVLVTVVVTEVLASTIEFSLLVGLPVGVIVGVLAGIFVLWARGSSDPAVSERAPSGWTWAGVATGLGWFAVAFLVVLVVGVGGGVRPTVSLEAGVVVGIVFGALGWFRFDR